MFRDWQGSKQAPSAGSQKKVVDCNWVKKLARVLKVNIASQVFRPVEWDSIPFRMQYSIMK